MDKKEDSAKKSNEHEEKLVFKSSSLIEEPL